jgi:hypothetical protein
MLAWQVAVSRSEHDAGSCLFCNKANYSVTYRAKSAAQRAAERKEREHVEQAVLHARQVLASLMHHGSDRQRTAACIESACKCVATCAATCTATAVIMSSGAQLAQEEDRRAEQRRSKHAANASTPMSPEQVCAMCAELSMLRCEDRGPAGAPVHLVFAVYRHMLS